MMIYRVKTFIAYIILSLAERIVKQPLRSQYLRYSFAQDGEDLVLISLLKKHSIASGFYVDIGAHHPFRFSNTYLLYQLGWHGLVIDAQPGSMKLFKSIRPRDICIETPISDRKEEITFYQFNEPALNGFSKELSESRQNNTYTIINQINMESRTINDVLAEYNTNNIPITLLTIDVEGYDYRIIQSLDFTKYAPHFIIIECHDDFDTSINSLLNKNSYDLVGMTSRSKIFMKHLK